MNLDTANTSSSIEIVLADATGLKARSSKNSKDVYGAVGKTNMLTFDPETLTLVTDKASPLYDERVSLPVDEKLVRNLMHYGQIQPGRVRKNPETGAIEVEVGRQRVKAMIEANKRLAERGEETLLFQAIVQRGDDNYRLGVGISENMQRQAETPLTIAAKAQRMFDRGATEEIVCTTFGFSKQTLHN